MKDESLNEVEISSAKAIETTCIGCVAIEMGYANQTHVCNAGRRVFDYIGRLTYKQFRLIKKFNSQSKQ